MGKQQVINWSRGNLESLLDQYRQMGKTCISDLPVSCLPINGLKLYRGVSRGELADGPKMYAGHIDRIQELTSWTESQEFAGQWGEVVIELYIPLDHLLCRAYGSPDYNGEREWIVIDYKSIEGGKGR